jgi:hypothetical protein
MITWYSPGGGAGALGGWTTSLNNVWLVDAEWTDQVEPEQRAPSSSP